MANVIQSNLGNSKFFPYELMSSRESTVLEIEQNKVSEQ